MTKRNEIDWTGRSELLKQRRAGQTLTKNGTCFKHPIASNSTSVILPRPDNLLCFVSVRKSKLIVLEEHKNQKFL